MGLFTKRRAAPAVTWEPLDGEVCAIPGAEVDDDGCAAEDAYETWLFGPQGASVTVAFYAGEQEGVYHIGFRYQYLAPGGWSHTGWGCADELFPGHESLGATSQQARQWAARLAAGDPHTMRLLTDVFEWDGVPW